MLTSDTLVPRVIRSGIATAETIVGCSEEDVRLLEEQVGVSLPSAYKDYLRVAGKCSGVLGLDAESHFPELLDLTRRSGEMVEQWEGRNLHLPARAFVVGSGCTEYFAFLITDQGASDPPIFSYFEGDGEFRHVSDSFWKMLETELGDLEAARIRTPDAPHWEVAMARARARVEWLRGG